MPNHALIWQNVFIDYFEGKREYSRNVSLKKSGDYIINVKGYDKGGITDEDIRFVRVFGEEKVEFGPILLIGGVVALSLLIIMLIRRIVFQPSKFI